MNRKKLACFSDTKLVRVHNRVHVRSCHHAQSADWTPWIWAEGRTRTGVELACLNGLKFCKTCDPVGVGWPR